MTTDTTDTSVYFGSNPSPDEISALPPCAVCGAAYDPSDAVTVTVPVRGVSGTYGGRQRMAVCSDDCRAAVSDGGDGR